MLQYISKSEKDTINLAKILAQNLHKGDIVVLSGDLGSGKTKFTEGVLQYFCIEHEISSPTFTIVNEYNTPKLDIFHFDVYRLEDVEEFYAIGGDEYFSKGLCIIEWGEIIESALPKDYIKINFFRDFENEDIRKINIEFLGEKYLQLEETLLKEV